MKKNILFIVLIFSLFVNTSIFGRSLYVTYKNNQGDKINIVNRLIVYHGKYIVGSKLTHFRGLPYYMNGNKDYNFGCRFLMYTNKGIKQFSSSAFIDKDKKNNLCLYDIGLTCKVQEIVKDALYKPISCNFKKNIYNKYHAEEKNEDFPKKIEKGYVVKIYVGSGLDKEYFLVLANKKAIYWNTYFFKDIPK